MMSALLHWALADWQALAHDLGAMGLLKQSTSRAELAADLQQHFTSMYAAALADSTDAAAGVQGAAGAHRVKQQQQQQRQQSVLLSKAGAISFGDFAGVIAALAVKYRFELPPYYTLVIRCAMQQEACGFVSFACNVHVGGNARAADPTFVQYVLCAQSTAQQLCLVTSSPCCRHMLVVHHIFGYYMH
jgi:hypothetical protein